MSIQAGCYTGLFIRGPNNVNNFQQCVSQCQAQPDAVGIALQTRPQSRSTTVECDCLTLTQLRQVNRVEVNSELCRPCTGYSGFTEQNCGRGGTRSLYVYPLAELLTPSSTTAANPDSTESSPTLPIPSASPSDSSSLNSNSGGGLSRTSLTIIISVVSVVSAALLSVVLYIVIRKKRFPRFGTRSINKPAQQTVESQFKPSETPTEQPNLPSVPAELTQLRSNETLHIPEHEVLVETQLHERTLPTTEPPFQHEQQYAQGFQYSQGYFYPNGFQDPQGFYASHYQAPYQHEALHDARFYDQSGQSATSQLNGVETSTEADGQNEDHGHVLKESVE
ncbi:hypothetical protein HDV05_001017 [Chytridiales sp. JEL 0842]|nr:hypothetical protein HDV05_001017 [Chytridiales sp. JEL 0842]